MVKDELHVVHARAAGLDVHKKPITGTVRLCSENGGEPMCETRTFGALAPGLTELVAWLTAHGVAAAAMEATGVYWQAPWEVLTEAGIEAQLLNARQFKQPAWPQDRCRGQSLARAGVSVRVGTDQLHPLRAVP